MGPYRQMSEYSRENERAIGFVIPLPLFFVFCIFGGRLLFWYWGYKHFSCIFAGERFSVLKTLAFTIFLPVSLSTIFKYYKLNARALGVDFPLPGLVMSVVFFLDSVLFVSIDSDVVDWITFGFNLAILAAVQWQVNRLNREHRPALYNSTKMTGKKWLGLLSGSVLLLAMIWFVYKMRH